MPKPLLLALIITVGVVLRVWALGERPPGLYHDEAYYGLDALRVLGGERPVFFEANNGREPLFIYLVAFGVGVLGQTPVAIRLAAAIVGSLTVPATYLMGRALFSPRVGLLAAAVTAVTVWTVNLSRVGFRASTMPLIVALCVWQGARACQTRRTAHFVAAGGLYGLLFYTYLAARFTPLALGVALAVAWMAGRRDIPWRGLLVAALAALVVAAPLLVHFAAHPEDALGRGGQVSIFNPAINYGNPWGLLARQIAATVGMFHLRGDFIPRHNVPLRPVFDPALGLAALVGLGVALRSWRASRGPAYGFSLAWTAVMLVPTVLAEDAPHFLRAVGVLPIALLFPALGLDTIWTWLDRRGLKRAGPLAAGLAVGLALALTWRDYFQVHTLSDKAYYQFETGAAELALQTNRFLETGWTGGWAAHKGEPNEQRRAYIDKRLWEGWPSLRYLVPSDRARVLTPERRLVGDELLLALWPYDDPSPILSRLPAAGLITIRQGALQQGDLERKASQLYYTVSVTPDLPLPNLLADFGVTELQRASWRREGDQARVELVWTARGPLPDNLAAFVHLLGPGGLVGQADGPPGGIYQGRLWQAGQTVSEERLIPIPPGVTPLTVQVGLYDRTTLKRVATVQGDDVLVVPAEAP